MEKPLINPISYMNEFRYRHNMASSLSERYRIPYRENSRAIDDNFRIIYFYQSHDGCEIMHNPSKVNEVFEITEKSNQSRSFHAKGEKSGKKTEILLQSTDAPFTKSKHSFISDIAGKYISLESSINRRFT